MPGVSSTVLGVLIMVGEYAVDSSENDLTVFPGTVNALLSGGESEMTLLADFGDGWFASGVVDTATHAQSRTFRRRIMGSRRERVVRL